MEAEVEGDAHRECPQPQGARNDAGANGLATSLLELIASRDPLAHAVWLLTYEHDLIISSLAP